MNYNIEEMSRIISKLKAAHIELTSEIQQLSQITTFLSTAWDAPSAKVFNSIMKPYYEETKKQLEKLNEEIELLESVHAIYDEAYTINTSLVRGLGVK